MRLDNVNLTPTMNCNLRCELCGVLVPQYKFRPQMTTDEVVKTLKALFNVVDQVGRLQITGGEPLMHPELDQILEESFRYKDYFNELWLFSNCAVPFRKTVLDLLAEHSDQTVVHCSDYGVKKEVSDNNIRLLKEKGIPFRYLKYYGENQYCEGWVDNGDFVPHYRTEKENEAIFSACPHVCRGGSWYIRHGQIHWCGRSVRGTELGKIPLREKDYLNLFDKDATVEELEKKLVRLRQVKCITACDYCNGLYGTEDVCRRLPAGKQMG